MSTRVVEDAKAYAIELHGKQRYGGTKPYSYHLDKVERVLVATGHDSDLWRVAAWLHDVIEDTAASLDDINERFGPEVGRLVWACSGFGENRKARNADISRKLAEFPLAATLKLADRIANMEVAIEEDAPKFMSMYAKEHAAFMAVIAPLDPPRALMIRMEDAYRTCNGRLWAT